MRYWISYGRKIGDPHTNAMEESDTASSAYERAIVLTEAGWLRVKIRDGDTFQSWGVEAFAAQHGLVAHQAPGPS